MSTEIKVSIPISFDLLKKIDSLAKERQENAVELIEKILADYAREMRQKRDAKDIEILNRIAEEQREEILETLEYQVDIWNEANFTELKSQPE
jgi:metal-responsive CopG/Arc/MetJ family transcriptional regulator